LRTWTIPAKKGKLYSEWLASLYSFAEKRMSDSTFNNVPWLLWPFYAIWRLLTLILNITGRIICIVFGIALMMCGVAISLSVIGAPLGVPLAALGFLLVIRALF
jgi:vacuolar-type H+-ATPase subunit I/STV1